MGTTDYIFSEHHDTAYQVEWYVEKKFSLKIFHGVVGRWKGHIVLPQSIRLCPNLALAIWVKVFQAGSSVSFGNIPAFFGTDWLPNDQWKDGEKILLHPRHTNVCGGIYTLHTYVGVYSFRFSVRSFVCTYIRSFVCHSITVSKFLRSSL